MKKELKAQEEPQPTVQKPSTQPDKDKDKDKEFYQLKQKTEKIAEKGRLNLLESYKEPANAIEFETDLKAFENDYKLALKYLQLTPAQTL